jgi:MerR family transcriptional regulator, aldehyde-responsive regulator
MTKYGPQQVAERCGLSVDTLRYYERIGLIPEVGRNSAGRRVYEERHLGILEALLCLRRSGMPVREMQRYVALARAGRHTAGDRADLLEQHRGVILERIEQLRRALAVVDEKIDFYRRYADAAGAETR